MRMKLLPWLALLLLFPLSSGTIAQDVPSPGTADTSIIDHETVVVSGALPGPGLWKVRKDGHTLYVLATLSPLPRRMEWESASVEAVVARAQRVLLPPSFTMDADVGLFRGLMLVPSLLKARRNPDGRSLQDVVPAADYARWLPLKQRYLGRDRGVERWRPIFAAQELYQAAMRRSGLALDDVVGDEVQRIARRHDVPLRAVNLKVEVEDPKAAIREFQTTALADTECFQRTLDRIQTDVEVMRQRANAWATGDVQTLQALPVASQYAACMDAVTGTALAQRLGIDDVRPRLESMWLAAAEEALEADEVSLALLPLGQAITPNGYLARLRERGYEVEAP
jgi:uncharacterized protein YbaP (TraB family)